MATFRECSTLPLLVGVLLSGACSAGVESTQTPRVPFEIRQAQAAARVWLSAENLRITDRSGNEFRKRGGWEIFQPSGDKLAFGLNAGATDYALTVEGDFVPAADPESNRTFSGPAVFRFNRSDDGRWLLKRVLLAGLELEGDADVEVPSPSYFAAAAVPGQPPGQRVVPLTQDEAKAAVATWLSKKLPLGSMLMKDPGGSAEFLGLGPGPGPSAFAASDAQLRLDGVPYHGLGAAAGEGVYSGAGVARFWYLNDGDGWSLQQMFLPDIQASWSPREQPAARIRFPASFVTTSPPQRPAS